MTPQTRTSLKELQQLDQEIAAVRSATQKFEPLLEEVDAPVLRLEQEVQALEKRVKESKFEEEKIRQKKIFRDQIEFALEHDLPLMLHCRPSEATMDSYLDVLEILEGYEAKARSSKKNRSPRGDVHFFVGNVEIAQRFLTLGFTLSFTGVITFTSDYDEVIRSIPLDMILSETDSPFVSPVPYRGVRNEPAYVVEVVKQIAHIRGEEYEKVREALVLNAKRMFDLTS